MVKRLFASDILQGAADKGKLEKFELCEENGMLKVRAVFANSLFEGPLTFIYTIFENGAVEAEQNGIPKVDLYRIGMRMELPGSYNRVKWYGRQPTWNTDICGRRKTVTAVMCVFWKLRINQEQA